MSSTCGLGAFSDYDQYVESTSTVEEKSELELYLAEPTKRLNENIDILGYWSKSAARYPQLARLARDILVVPVSSVASESAFSLSKKVITPSRASLKPKTVEALMCLQDWYRCKLEKKDVVVGNKRKAEVVELDDENSSSDDECNIHILCSCQLVKFNMYFS